MLTVNLLSIAMGATTFSIMGLFATLSINDTLIKVSSIIVLNVVMLNFIVMSVVFFLLCLVLLC